MKKCMVAALILAAAVLLATACDGGSGGNKSPPVYIKIPDDGEIKVVSTTPPGLEIKWEKLGVASFYQIQLVGAVTNATAGEIKIDEIVFLYDGRQVDFVRGQTLGHGESLRITKQLLQEENVKVLEVKVRVSPTATASPTVSPAPSSEPEEVVVKWLSLQKQGKFKETLELYSPDGKKRIDSRGGVDYLKGKWDAKPISKITIIRTQHEKGSTPPQANVYVSIAYVDSGYMPDGQFNFEYLNGVWKITYSEGR